MDKIVIDGGRKLSGSVEISGSKNAALPILIATLLTDDVCVIDNVPELEDINIVIALLDHLGKKIIRKKNRITVAGNGKLQTDAPFELVSKMRASVLVAGPVMARYKKVRIPLPGGCAIGVRPINIHLDGFKKLGAKCRVSDGYVKISAKKLNCAKIALDFPSVGATENLLTAATLINGETIIKNAAAEPEITDLINFLKKLGANITCTGKRTIRIRGVKKLSGCMYRIMPDRIETGTFIIASAITGGAIKINGAVGGHNESLIKKIKSAGTKVLTAGEVLRVTGQSKIKPVNAKTQVYPGFATDLQPLWMALMSVAAGKSVITETIFENRLQTVAEFIKMGADIKISKNSAIIKGVKNFKGTKVAASDLRSAAALILAGLSAKGKTEITGLKYLDRGYENIVGKLKKLGAGIKRVAK